MGELFLMRKKFIYLTAFLVVFTLVLTACSKGDSTTTTKKRPEQLSGVYKETAKDTPQDDQGRDQPNYFYFKKDGTLLLAQPETGDSDKGNYGDAERGTWKRISKNRFKLKLTSIHDKDHYTLIMKKSGSRLTTKGTAKDASFEWDQDSYQKTEMTKNDFMDLFKAAKESQQKEIQENGFTEPDNDNDSESNTDNQSSNNNSSDAIDAEERAAAFKNGGRWITDKSDPEYYSDANAYVTYLQIKDGVKSGTTNPDGTETAQGMAEDE